MEQGGPAWTANQATKIRSELERILESDLFSQAPQQASFLTYVVDNELSGTGAQINQYAIAMDVFGRDESFDPLTDSVVRVEARRLRSRLTEYYAGQGVADTTILTLPKGRYRLAVDFREVQSQPRAESSRAGATPRRANVAIAVLPFDNLSADPEQEYFSDGMAEDIITDLSKQADITVISRHSSFAYKGKAVSCRDIGSELGVDYVLEGSVRKVENKVRINTQLIDATTDDHVWAERYDRQLDDIFRIQDDVTREIVSALKPSLIGNPKAKANRRGTENVNAHDLYLRAREQYYLFTPESIDLAQHLARHCVDEDPGFSDAFAMLARVLIFRFITVRYEDQAEVLEPALDAARKAVAIDEESELAHATLGWTLLYCRNIVEAIEQVDKAVVLGGAMAESHRCHSLVYSSAGDGRTGLSSMERSIELNPFYTAPDLMAIGIALFALERYEEALVEFERGIQLNPAFAFCHIFKIATLGVLDRLEEAHTAITFAAESIGGRGPFRSIVENVSFFNDRALQDRYAEGLARAQKQGPTSRRPRARG